MHSRINMNISLLGGGTELIVHEVTPRKESRIRTFLTWGGGQDIILLVSTASAVGGVLGMF